MKKVRRYHRVIRRYHLDSAVGRHTGAIPRCTSPWNTDTGPPCSLKHTILEVTRVHRLRFRFHEIDLPNLRIWVNLSIVVNRI